MEGISWGIGFAKVQLFFQCPPIFVSREGGKASAAGRAEEGEEGAEGEGWPGERMGLLTRWHGEQPRAGQRPLGQKSVKKVLNLGVKMLLVWGKLIISLKGYRSYHTKGYRFLAVSKVLSLPSGQHLFVMPVQRCQAKRVSSADGVTFHRVFGVSFHRAFGVSSDQQMG